MKPIDILVQELSKWNGQLCKLRQKLGITKPDVSAEMLSWKEPGTTFKLTGTKSGWFVYYRESWVVKFSPVDKQDDPWYDVYKEYDLLRALSSPPAVRIPAPDPLHRSTEVESRVVGTKFIIMSFVEGKSFENANSIPEQYRERAFTSVMRTLAKNVHYYYWTNGSGEYKEHLQSETFWTEQETVWKRNYEAAAARTGHHSHQSEAHKFFKQMSCATKPSHKNIRIIHGDMKISNVIFDDQCNVKAIVDWKSFENGDPMVDVAYLCLTFMTPGDYGEKFRALNNHPLLLGNRDNMEAKVLQIYKTDGRNFPFDEKAFNFSKAVCCQRWLSILQAARADNFVGHESGDYEDNKDHTQLVMDYLATAGKSFYTQSTS